MDKTLQFASVFVAIVAALGAWASQRAAARASVMNTNTTSRVDMEKDAYDRARKYDTDTIQRQDGEIEELRTDIAAVRAENRQLLSDNDQLRHDNDELRRDNDDLRNRISRLESQLLPNSQKEANT